MQKLATIEIIKDIKPALNSDFLELCYVLGYQCVVKKNEFKIGDKIVFVFSDTLMQPFEWNKFLWDKKYPERAIRVRICKLRGNISDGIVFPLTILPCYGVMDFPEGTEVDGLLKISKYEKEQNIQIAGNQEGKFPTNLISITDEDNILSNPMCVGEFKGRECYVSVKVDGMSSSFIFNNGKFSICSRRFELKKEDSGVYGFIAQKYKLEEKLSKLGYNVAVQGEICGPKIQGNPLGLKEAGLAVFNVKNLDSGEHFGLYKIREFCSTLGLQMPDIGREFIWDENMTISDLQNWANEAKYSNGNPAEGIVVRPISPVYSEILRKYFSVKILNQNYSGN